MRRYFHIALVSVLLVVAALIGVGCFYRGYLAGILPSAAAEMV